MSKVCKFYIQGNCHYGQSCRFSHSDNRSNRYNNQYYDGYYSDTSYKNLNRQYEEISYSESRSYRNYDQHEQNNYQTGKKYYNLKTDYDSKNNYNQKNNYYDEDYENIANYQSKKDHTAINYYNHVENKYKSNRNRNNYTESTELSHQSINVNNQEYNTHNYNVHSNQIGYKNSVYFKNNKQNHEQNYHSEKFTTEKDKLLTLYKNEIKTYQSHLKTLLASNVWPFTCFHPIGHTFIIQPIGQLNFLDISFEEIRCDYYIAKTVCVNPGLIHKRLLDDLMLKARAQKEDVFSFSDSVQDDMLATFRKCEQSKSNSEFENCIQTDLNSYWNMSLNYMDIPNTKNTLESFSFVIDNEKVDTKKTKKGSVKIFMQSEVYGKDQNCKAYDDEYFTDYIPIIPPPKKNCV